MKKPVTPKPQLNLPAYSTTQPFVWAIIAGIIGFLLYLNTINNGYVLDDNYAITRNLYVQEGISGIPKLFTVDFWFFENTKLGYYRPLGLSTFAIEHQFFGDNPAVGHFDNALLFGLTGFILCLFCLKFMKSKHPAFAFLISLIFIAHPIHTEAVANIKSRDEVLSFLNIFVMLYFALRYQETKKRPDLVLSLVFFYLALLSKETAMVGIVLLPLFLYYSGKKIPQAVLQSLPYAAIVGLFLIQKQFFLGGDNFKDIVDHVNYPYATKLVKLPTAFHIFAVCIGKLIFPWPQSYDYSYNQIPASHWKDGGAWLGLGLFGFMAFAAIREGLKKTYWGLGLCIILITLVPSLAFVYLRGGIMAERFLYAPCFGFAILVVYALSLAFPKSENPKLTLPEWLKSNIALTSIVLVMCLVFSLKTVGRNRVWKDQISLFSDGAKNSPNSVQVHKHYGTALFEAGRFEKDSAKRREDFTLGMNEMSKALVIYPDWGDAYYEMGFAYQLVEVNLDSAIKYYKKSLDFTPGSANALNNLGIAYETKGNFPMASYYYNKTIEANPQFPDGVKNAANLKKKMGLDVHILPPEDIKPGSISAGNPNVKIDSFIPENVKKFNEYKSKGAEAVNKGDFATGIVNFKKASQIMPNDKENLIFLANSYGMAKQYQNAVNTFEHILTLYPDNQLVLRNLAQTYAVMGQKDKAEEVAKRLKK